MPYGPKGEYRPADPIQAAVIVAKIAVGEMTEDDARKLASQPKVCPIHRVPFRLMRVAGGDFHKRCPKCESYRASL